MRRPSREWLEALVSGALLTSCANAGAPPAPAPVAAPLVSPAPPEPVAAPPAPSSQPAPVTQAPTSVSSPRVELPAFDARTCKAPSPKPEPPCAGDTENEETALIANLIGVRAACALDGLLVVQVDRAGRAEGTAPELKELARAGDLCGASLDKAACASRLKDIDFPEQGGIADFGGRLFVVVARGNSLELISSREQIAALIGPVDSKQDAATLLWLEGWGNTCSKLQAQGNSFVVPKNEVGMICPPMMRGTLGGYSIPRPPAGYEKQGNYRVQIDRQGKVKVTYLGGAPQEGDPGFGIACGRRPSGMALTGAAGAVAGEEVGRYLAACAELEAAAVNAFELMARELTAHGAPAIFVARCRSAAEDERRHTELMTRAARRYGVEPLLPPRYERALPSLLELARENTIEGCVRETWGALAAALQARTAQDAELAAMYASIAPDELAHAELAWDLQTWFSERLSGGADLPRIAGAACAQLLAEQREPEAAVAALAGAPGRTVARRLIEQLAA